jgi:hypothetical protein
MKRLLICLTALLFITGCSDAPASNILDLTVLSDTVLSAMYDHIMANPDGYVGQTIKARGVYAVFFWEVTDRDHHYVMTKEGSQDSCCGGYFEFIYNEGGHYPEEGADIEMTGVFSSYQAQGRPLYYLAVDDITVLG